MEQMICSLCASNTGLHNFAENCCRVRFLMAQPGRQARAGWLDRWAKKLPQSRMDEIKNELVKRFELKNKKEKSA
ncbi:MAG: hypothetical protein ACYC4K_08265 [Thiobacillus sp.]